MDSSRVLEELEELGVARGRRKETDGRNEDECG